MTIFDNYEVWFVIGSQHPDGRKPCVRSPHAEHVVNALNTEAKLPCKLVLKPLGTTPDEITAIRRDGELRLLLRWSGGGAAPSSRPNLSTA
ncbi:hypothetical protein ACNKHT_00430 [Shigella flexneri]